MAENENLEKELTRDEVNAELAKQAEQEVTEPEGFNYEIEIDGKIQKYDSIDSVRKAHLSAVSAMRDRERQIEQLKNEMASRPQPTQPQKADESEGSFDSRVYYDMLGKDPKKANEYAIRATLGMDPNEIREVLGEVQSMRKTNTERSALESFYREVKDYPATEENAALMTAKINELTSQGFPMSGKTLKLAYRELVEAGSITPATKTESSESRGTKAPPAVKEVQSSDGGGGGKDPYSMTLDQLREMVEREHATQGN